MVDGPDLPAGFVNRADDCNDRMPTYIRADMKSRATTMDDDCDGRIDEPEPVYPTDPYPITYYWRLLDVGEASTAMPSWRSSTTEASTCTYILISGTTGVLDGYGPVGINDVSNDGVTNRMGFPGPGGLYELSAYKAVAHFFNYRGQELSISDSYFVMTDPYYTTDPWTEDRLERARYWIVNRALYEESLSRYGEVGYRGTLRVDGTRYGAPSNRLWCSEFYSWTTSPNLNGSGGKTSVSELKDYFAGYGAWVAPSAGQPGDYLGLDTDGDGKKNHSGMVLSQTGADITQQWTIEGNVADEVHIGRRALTGSQVVGRGVIKSSMLR